VIGGRVGGECAENLLPGFWRLNWPVLED